MVGKCACVCILLCGDDVHDLYSLTTTTEMLSDENRERAKSSSFSAPSCASLMSALHSKSAASWSSHTSQS